MQIGGKGLGEIQAAIQSSYARVSIAASAWWNSSQNQGPVDPVSAVDERAVVPNERIKVGKHDDPKDRVSVMSYNILAPTYVSWRWVRYPWATAEVLDIDYRLTRITQEITYFDPDIIGLQEVQDTVFPKLQKSLGEIGYLGEYIQKTNGRLDGVALFYRQDKFTRIASLEIKIDELARQECERWSLDPGPLGILQGTVAQAILLETKNKELILASNIHVYYLWLRPDVQSVQIGLTLQRLKRFIKKYQQERPITLVLCGDFNAEPGGIPYHLLINGSVSERMLKQFALFSDDTLQLAVRKENGKKNERKENRREKGRRWKEEKEEEEEERRFEENEEEEEEEEEEPYEEYPFQNALSHQFNLRSAYREVLGGEPTFTNFVADFIGTLDYILYGRLQEENEVKEKEEKEKDKEEVKKQKKLLKKRKKGKVLEVTEVVNTVHRSLVERHVGCPNVQFPSDHISLNAVFRYM